MPNTVEDIWVSVDFTATARNNTTIRFKAFFQGRIRKFMTGVIYRQEAKLLRNGVSDVMVAPNNKGRLP